MQEGKKNSPLKSKLKWTNDSKPFVPKNNTQNDVVSAPVSEKKQPKSKASFKKTQWRKNKAGPSRSNNRKKRAGPSRSNKGKCLYSSAIYQYLSSNSAEPIFMRKNGIAIKDYSLTKIQRILTDYNTRKSKSFDNAKKSGKRIRNERTLAELGDIDGKPVLMITNLRWDPAQSRRTNAIPRISNCFVPIGKDCEGSEWCFDNIPTLHELMLAFVKWLNANMTNLSILEVPEKLAIRLTQLLDTKNHASSPDYFTGMRGIETLVDILLGDTREILCWCMSRDNKHTHCLTCTRTCKCEEPTHTGCKKHCSRDCSAHQMI